METQRCPLCQIRAEQGVLEHLRRDHRRTEAEARALMERYRDGTLGWNAEGGKGRRQPPSLPKSPLRGCESCGTLLCWGGSSSPAKSYSKDHREGPVGVISRTKTARSSFCGYLLRAIMARNRPCV